MKKLLVICGPTATGKTGLALHLAKEFNGELVSADSRQVYKDLDIGTGKDLPKSSKFREKNPKLPGYYEIEGVKVWGYDLVFPKEEFSVGQYIKVANKVIENIWSRKKLPILVGGTGFYIKGIVDGISTALIPKNKAVRKSLERRSIKELFNALAQLAPIRAGSMNISDRKNPRRLVRAIEVAQWRLKSGAKAKTEKDDLGSQAPALFVGLTGPKNFLYQRIKKRIKVRLRQGVEGEVEKLLESGVSWKNQSMDSLGYKQWKGYFERKITKEKVVRKWEREECKYAKRQITWFKKDKRINWFNIKDSDWQKSVEKLVKKWYSTKHNASTKKN
jgi:tRNA dimethylallyltransferase